MEPRKITFRRRSHGRALAWTAALLVHVTLLARAMKHAGLARGALDWIGPRWKTEAYALFAMAAVLLVVAVLTSLPRTKRGRVVARREGGLEIEVDGARSALALEDVDSAMVLPATSPEVEVRLRDGRALRFEVQDRGTGERLLEEAGLARRNLRVALPALTNTAPIGCLGAGLAPLVALAVLLGSGVPPMAFFVLLATVIAASLCWLGLGGFLTTEVTVGADGVEIARGSSRRFVAFRDVTSVIRTAHVIAIGTSRGEVVSLPIGALGAAQAAVLSARIAREMERSREVAPPLDALARGDRPVDVWRREVTERAGLDYRALSPEQLQLAIAGGNVEPDRRIAAALALRAIEGDDARQRIRVAAAAHADRKVRVALEKIADGDDDLDQPLAEATRR